MAPTRPLPQIIYQPRTTSSTSSSTASWTLPPSTLNKYDTKVSVKLDSNDLSKIDAVPYTPNASKGIVLLHLSKEKKFDPRKLDFSTLTLPNVNKNVGCKN